MAAPLADRCHQGYLRGSQRPRFGMPIGKINPTIQRPIMNDRVRIQDEDIFALGFANANVISLGKAQVRAIFDHPDRGNCSRIFSTDPSVEPLSETTTS